MEVIIPVHGLTIIEKKELWDEIIKTFPVNDVYYTYEYCKWNATKESGEAKLVYFKNKFGTVIYPFIKRRIFQNTERQLYDITTPYGYGGPLISGDESVLEEFTRLFRNYCWEANIISEVVRMHPLLKNASYLSAYCDLHYVRKTTAVDLSCDLSQIRENYSSMNKRNIKRALSNSLTCAEVSKSDENISTFLNLYNRTMERKKAADYYYFSFSSIHEQLTDTQISRSHLVFVYFGHTVIAAAIFFTTNQFAHYHLGASDEDYLFLRPNNLIFDFMVMSAKKRDCLLLHLGGGCAENDTLFEYKTSFTNNNNFDFLLGTNIYNYEVYKELVEKAIQRSIIKEGYFPLYRSI